MADRTVNVRLNLDNANYRRNATESAQDSRRMAAAARTAAAEQQQAFTRSAAGISSAMERASRSVVAGGRLAQESATRTAASMNRLAAAAEEVPVAFASSANIASRSLGQIATSATTTAQAVASAETRMTEASAAAAQGIRLSLSSRLALGEAVIAQQAEMAAASTTAAAATGRSWAAAGEQGERAFGVVRTAGLLMLGVFAAASVTAARFEKAMSGVRAVADATAEQMGELRAAALDAGRTTAFTASQAAEAEGELARAGVSVADITGGALKGALSLAAAGQLSLGESATIAAQSMNTFGLRGEDVGHVADVLASAANKSAADVHGLGESMRMGGLLAKQTGLSLEDTAGALAAFADHALVGSDAGTSLKTMLQRLTPQSDEAAAMMESLGFSAYDAQGKFVGLSELAGRMRTSFAQLTPEARNSAMGVIFGSDAVRAATILYEQGTFGIKSYVSAVNDQGAASRMAAVQMDNLVGDLEHFKGAVEVALIEGGTEANSVLREMVQWLTRLVNAWSALPPWVQTTSVVLLGVVGAVATLGAGFLMVLPRIAAFQASLTALSTTMPRLASAASNTVGFLTNPWVAGLGLAISVLGAFALANRGATKNIDDLTAAVKADSGAVAENTRVLVAQKLQQSGALDTARKYGIDLAKVTDAALGQQSAIDAVNKELQKNATHHQVVTKAQSAHGQKMNELNDDAKALRDTIIGTSGDVTNAAQAYRNQQAAAAGAADSTTDLGKAASKTAADLADTRTEAEKLSDALDNLNGKNIDAARSAISFQKSLADMRDAVKESGTSLDITTEKGRQVKEAILGAASAAMSHAEAVMKQTGSQEAAQIVYAQDIAALKATMSQLGLTTTQVDSLIAAYGRLPVAKQTVVTDPGALQTIEDLQEIKKKVEGIPPGKSITVKAPSADAIHDLEAVGYKVQTLPDGKVKITVPTNDAFDGVNKIQHMINSITDRQVRVLVNGMVTLDGEYLHGGRGPGFANGGVVHAANGYTIPGYAPRQDTVPIWASPGESILVPEATRKLGGAGAIDALNAWGRYGTPLPAHLIPARQLAVAGGSTSTDNRRSTTVHLHGAGQSGQEQLADLVRHLAFVG